MEATGSAGNTMRIMFEESPIAMCAALADGTVVRKNHAYEALGGVAGSVFELVRFLHRDALAAAIGEVAAGTKRSALLEVEIRSGDDRWVEVSVLQMRGGTGDVMLHIVDVSERRRRESRLRELAERDPLTGLHNRLSFHRVLEERLQSDPVGSLMFLDLDGFKAVNDRRGHQSGDDALIAVARAIRDAAGENDVVARLGGDEFALLLEADVRTACAFGTTLIRRISLAAALQGNPRITASVGVTPLRRGCDIESVLGEVDRAMYAAKRSGKGRCVLASITGERAANTA